MKDAVPSALMNTACVEVLNAPENNRVKQTHGTHEHSLVPALHKTAFFT